MLRRGGSGLRGMQGAAGIAAGRLFRGTIAPLGGLAERLNAPVLKTGKALRPSWV